MKFALLVLALVVYAEGGPRAPLLRAVHPNKLTGSSTPFIVAGRNVGSKSRYPHMLSLRFCSGGCSHTCGSVILRADRGLTAAHCTSGRNNFEVAAGQLNQGDEDQRINVLTMIEHQNYGGSAPGIPNDICILVFAGSLNIGGNVGVGRLPSSANQDFTGNECWSCGWGRLSGDGGAIPSRLQEVQMSVLTNSACANGMPANLRDNILSSHICVYDTARGGVGGVCQGDSGGPLNCNVGGSWTIAGVTSWVVGNIFDSCLQEYPQVYTRTSSFLGWIANNIN